MEDNKLKVEGLGVNTVPSVEGMNKTVNVTETPTVAPAQAAPKIDVTAAPTVSTAAPATKIDPSAIPTATTTGSSSNFDYKTILFIAGGVFALIAVIILIYSSVGGKKLTCTKSEEMLGTKTETKIFIKYDVDKKIKSYRVEVKEDYTNSSMYGDEPDSYFDNKLKEATKYIESNNLKTKREGKVLTYSYDFNNEGLQSYSYTKYEDLKAQLEKMSYTCSEK